VTTNEYLPPFSRGQFRHGRPGKVALYTQQTYVGVGLGLGLRLVGLVGLG